MKSTRNLRLQIRLTQAALVLLLAVGTTAAVSTHQLLLDAANHPTSDFSLASPHVVDTLDAARLPASAVQSSVSGQVDLTGKQLFASQFGFNADGQGEVIVPNEDNESRGILFRNASSGQNEFSTDGNGDLTVQGNLSSFGRLLADNYSLYSDGYGDLTTTTVDCSGEFSADQGDVSSDGNGDLTVQGLLTCGLLTSFRLISDYGNIYSDGSGFLTTNGLDCNATLETRTLDCDNAFTADQQNIFSDGSGGLTVQSLSSGTGLAIDNQGDLILNGTSGLFIAGAYLPLIDGATRNARFANVAASGTVVAGGGIGVFGHAVPTIQPATPTTLAQAIAVLQAYGLCQ